MSARVEAAIREAAVFDYVEQNRIWIEESGFTRGTVRWDADGFFEIEFPVVGATYKHSNFAWWRSVATPKQLIQWASLITWGEGSQLDDFFSAWLQVWQFKQPI